MTMTMSALRGLLLLAMHLIVAGCQGAPDEAPAQIPAPPSVESLQHDVQSAPLEKQADLGG
jgi:starvation-inducible outer membrane lipoprotein